MGAFNVIFMGPVFLSINWILFAVNIIILLLAGYRAAMVMRRRELARNLRTVIFLIAFIGEICKLSSRLFVDHISSF